MNADFETSVTRDAALQTFAAELTLAAYGVALRTRTRGSWLDLEVDLWRALADTVKTWGEGMTLMPPAGDAACAIQRR